MTVRATQFLRDLDWAINSPSLVQDVELPDVRWTRRDVDRACVLNPFSKSQPSRTGRYFESLLQFWISDVQRFKLLHAGRQVIIDGRTLGELDFVFQDDHDRLVHLEAAVKFYLHYFDPEHRVSYWPGPNSRDSFSRKLKRIKQHQLPLGKRVCGENVLSAASVKGRMFFHLTESPPENLPRELNRNCLTGWWVYAHQLPLLQERAPEGSFVELVKPFWLSNYEEPLENERTTFSYEQLETRCRHQVIRKGRALHVAIVAEQTGAIREVTRGFIMPASWPNRKHLDGMSSTG